MRLFTADIGSFCKSKDEVSAAGYALVRYAAHRLWGECPEIVVPGEGRPYFAGEGKYFSMSHTGTRVLVGVSDAPLGVDAEQRRTLRSGLVERVTTQAERSNFEFFELWTLREAVFKLTGRGALMSMRLRRGPSGEIVTPFKGVHCRSYTQIPRCAAAAASNGDDFPEEIENVPPEAFLT